MKAAHNQIKISAVSYLNTRPFVYGIEKSGYMGDYQLQLDNPSECAHKLLTGQVDIGLIPIAAIPKLDNPIMLSSYCIGANGDVGSVVLVSDVPLNEIREIYLDYQSETSILLIKIICDKYWNINPLWINSKRGYENQIGGVRAGVIIGDRALQWKDKFAFCYDLAGEWFKHTSLPFVFACWVANKQLPADFIKSFEKAISWGVANKLESIRDIGTAPNSELYIKQSISYELNESKKKAMALFLEYAGEPGYAT